MIKCYSKRRTEKLLSRYGSWIDTICERYGIPTALVKAVLYKEMTEIDLLDIAADLVVASGCFAKKDSSTGYGQIFGRTGLAALNFASDRGLTSYEALQIPTDHRLDEHDIKDVRKVWFKLHRDPRFNIELSALTLLAAAQEMTGSLDFSSFSDNELKLILTRYNADVKRITPYGSEVFTLYQKMSRL